MDFELCHWLNQNVDEQESLVVKKQPMYARSLYEWLLNGEGFMKKNAY